MATTSTVRIGEPKFLELGRGKAFFPGYGLLVSILLHASVLATLTLTRYLLPDPPYLDIRVAHLPVLVELPVTAESAEPVPFLPEVGPTRAPREISSSDSGSPRLLAPRLVRPHKAPVAVASAPIPPPMPEVLPVFSGPQRIVSKVPDSTNSVQTIRRPDLVLPPKLKFPIRVRSMVVGPAVPTALPSLAQQPPPEGLRSTAEPIVEKPVLPIKVANSVSESKVEESALPRSPANVPAAVRTQAAALSVSNPTLADQKTAVVINAIPVPSDLPIVPDAEIAGRFAVIPSAPPQNGDATVAAASAHAGNGKSSGTPSDSGGIGTQAGGPVAALKPGPAGNADHGSGSGAGLNSGAGVGSGKGQGKSNPSGGAGTKNGTGDSGAATGHNGLPGISISGGTSGGTTVSRPPSRPSPYGITVISSGSNGGAMRDMGVFRRDELVYTVYMSISDAGLGSAWPMQYALMGANRSTRGLLVPPYPTTKIPAFIAGSGSRPTQPVFISGLLLENGELQDLRPVKYDANNIAAMDTLKGWRFTPAQLDGRPVAVKVLIGVNFAPATPSKKEVVGPAPSDSTVR